MKISTIATISLIPSIANCDNYFYQYSDTSVGPATSYLDPSYARCKLFSGNPENLDNNTKIQGPFATDKFVQGITDLCQRGLFYSSCTPVIPYVEYLVKSGLIASSYYSFNNNQPLGSSQLRDVITQGNETNPEHIDMSAHNDNENVGSETKIFPIQVDSSNNTNNTMVVQAVSFQTTLINQTRYFIHGIPNVNQTGLDELEKSRGMKLNQQFLKQGIKVSFSINKTIDDANTNITMDYQSVASNIAYQWYNKTVNYNISNFFAYVNNPKWQINIRIEPSEYGFNLRNHSTYLCGDMGPWRRITKPQQQHKNTTSAYTKNNTSAAPPTDTPQSTATTAASSTTTTATSTASFYKINIFSILFAFFFFI